MFCHWLPYVLFTHVRDFLSAISCMTERLIATRNEPSTLERVLGTSPRPEIENFENYLAFRTSVLREPREGLDQEIQDFS